MEELLCYKLACAFLAVILLGCLVYMKCRARNTRGFQVASKKQLTAKQSPEDSDSDESTIDEQQEDEDGAASGATKKTN